MGRTFKNDINVVSNTVSGRQGWAYICNSGEFPVLECDTNLTQEYESYHTYGKVRLAWNYNGHELFHTCTLAHDIGEDGNKDKWELTSGGTCLSASFTYGDAMQLMKEAQLPVVRKDQIVAIVTHNHSYAFISLYKATHIDINCVTAAVLKPLTDEEMEQFVKDANRWCNR